MHYVEQIDAEIAKLEGQLLHWKARRNACVPFGRLPNEVLVRILWLAHLQPGPVENENFTAWDRPKVDARWPVATRICSRLRALAFDLPELWTFVDLNQLETEDAFNWHVERAGGRGLAVESRPPDEDGWASQARDDWESQARDEGRFKVHTFPAVAFPLFNQPQSRDAANCACNTKRRRVPVSHVSRQSWVLQKSANINGVYLTVESETDPLAVAVRRGELRPTSLELVFKKQHVLSSNFCGEHQSHLVRLSLVHISLWSTPQFSSLTHLNLARFFTKRLHKELCNILSRTPRLEVLCLSELTSVAQDDVGDLLATLHRRLNLPFLRILRAEYNSALYLHALLHSLPPPQERVHLVLHDDVVHNNVDINTDFRFHTEILDQLRLFHRGSPTSDAMDQPLGALPPVVRVLVYLASGVEKRPMVELEVALGAAISYTACWPHQHSQLIATHYASLVGTARVDMDVATKYFLPAGSYTPVGLREISDLPVLHTLELNITEGMEDDAYTSRAILNWLTLRTETGRAVHTIRFLASTQARKDALVSIFFKHRTLSENIPVVRRIVWKGQDTEESWDVDLE